MASIPLRLTGSRGRLTRAQPPVKLENPSYLTLNRDGSRLYSVLETQTYHGKKGGGVAAFSVDAEGALSPLGEQPTLGEDPCYLSTDGEYLLAANYSGGSMAVFPLGRKGEILPQSSLTVHSGSGPVPERQSQAHVHCTDFAPDGGLIYAVDLGLDAVRLYGLDRAGGAVKPEDGEIRLRPGFGPRHAVFHRGLRSVYIVGELSSSVAVFRYETRDGKVRFEQVQELSALPEDFHGENTGAAVRLSPDGRFLYASNRGHDSIAVFRVREDGTLESAGFCPSGGRGPRDFAIDPRGEFLLAANEKSGNVAVFRLNSKTGMPEPTGEGASLHAPVCVCFRPERAPGYDYETAVDRRSCGSSKWNMVTREMGPGNEDVIPLSMADMELKTAPEITEALAESVRFGMYGYTEPTESYYESVVGWMERRHGWKVEKDWISLSPGVVSALYTAVRALTRPGDGVILQRPVYYPFTFAAEHNGCRILDNALVVRNGRYEMDYDDLEQKASDPGAKVLVLCSPHNPVGRVWTRDELRRAGEICLRHGVTVLSDEIHFDFVYQPYRHTVFASISPELAQNCMVLTAPSKTFNLAGLQTSNIIIPNPDLRKKYAAASADCAIHSLNYFGYTACEAAYRKGEPWLEGLLAHLEGNRSFLLDFMREKLPQIPVTEPEGTYLVWLDFRSLGMTPKRLEQFLREKARIFSDEGSLFGTEGDGFERFNIACPRAMLEKALENLKRAVDSLTE